MQLYAGIQPFARLSETWMRLNNTQGSVRAQMCLIKPDALRLVQHEAVGNAFIDQLIFILQV
jgi:hypothetical protein